jgi:glycosyltransferase involved in cell wall biosynthesis
MKRAIFTIARAGQHASATSLMQSLGQAHPDIARFVVPADQPAAFEPVAETLACERLGIAGLDNMRLWYSPHEFAAALKPSAFRALCQAGFAELCFLAPDRPPPDLRSVFAALARHSLVVTPRLSAPDPLGVAAELKLLLTGIYDLGFLAVRRDPDSAALLHWWEQRCFLHCRDHPAAGMYLDQRWLDLAPGLVAKTAVLRGVLPGAAPPAEPVHASFPNGRIIEPAMRHWLLRAIDEGRLDPHARLNIDAAFFDQPDETAEARGITLTRLMYQMWLDRPELAQLFDIHTPSGLDAYVDWVLRGDADISAASLAAATNLFEPKPVQPDDAPPWPSVSRDAWNGPASQVDSWLGGDVTAPFGSVNRLLPRQVALQWELRADLQAAYNLAGLESFNDFIGWALTSACAENVVDAALFSADFAAQLAQSAPARPDEVPITAAMLATRAVPLRRDYLNGWERFPAERRGRLAHALWAAFVAPRQFGWPASISAPLRRYFDGESDMICGRFRFSRGALALLELRDDLRRAFPLADAASRWRFLHWLTVEGLRELELSLDAFDPRLRRFLAGPSTTLPGDSVAIEMAYRAREDLQAVFDITTPSGRLALHGWAEQHFLPTYATAPLGAVALHTPARAPRFARHARIGLTGHWGEVSGRGEDLRATALALDAIGFTDYLVIDRDSLAVIQPDGTEVAAEDAVHVAVNIVHMNADTALDDWWLLRRRGVTAERSIGFWAWELETLPRAWRHAFSFYDEIWAATEFARIAFAAVALRPVTLMRMAVSIAAQKPAKRRAGGVTSFLVLFDFRSFFHRKNPQAAIAAFLQAFPTGREKVRLVIKTQGAEPGSPDWRALQAACTDPRIELLSVTLPRAELLALIAGCDALVSLHRAEGFGRVLAEAMLLGKPVITTSYSGPADFIDADSACPVGFSLRPVKRDEYPGVEGQSWAEPDIADAARWMQCVHTRPAEAAAIGARGRAAVQRLYAPELVGHAVLAALGPGQRRRRRLQPQGGSPP